MNLVTLPALKRLRYAADDSVTLPKLQRWARDGRIPGAFKRDEDGDWQVDLDEFDSATAAAKVTSRQQNSRGNRLVQMVLDRLNEGKAT